MTIDKSIPGFTDVYKSTEIMDHDGFNFYLRLTMIDMDPNDTLYMEIPADYETKPIEKLIVDFFPADEAAREEIKSELEVEEYPELPEVYDYFYNQIDDARNGRTILDYSISKGPESIATTDLVYDHLSLTKEDASGEPFKVLHLVLEIHNVPFSDFTDQVEAARLKQEFRGLFLFALVHGGRVTEIAPEHIVDEVAEAIAYGEEKDILKCRKALMGDQMKLSVTGNGKKFFEELYNEAQYYTSRFEIFSKVLVDEDYIRFNNVDGEDYRIQVMRHEGVDVYRAVMIMNIMSDSLEQVADWEQEVRSPNFFARYLGACVNSAIDIPQQTLRLMIKQGKELLEGDEESSW